MCIDKTKFISMFFMSQKKIVSNFNYQLKNIFHENQKRNGVIIFFSIPKSILF